MKYKCKYNHEHRLKSQAKKCGVKGSKLYKKYHCQNKKSIKKVQQDQQNIFENLINQISSDQDNKYQKDVGDQTEMKINKHSEQTLKQKRWLNDQIINAYLLLIQKKISRKNSQFKILNTYFSIKTVMYNKKSIVYFQKKGINQQNKLIIPINLNQNHWIFAIISSQSFNIYDSLLKQKIFYEQNTTIKILLLFFNSYYKKQLNIKCQQNYFQQDNQYDCGIYLICGIERIIYNYEARWKISLNTKDQRLRIFTQIVKNYRVK